VTGESALRINPSYNSFTVMTLMLMMMMMMMMMTMMMERVMKE
jgi:hypothetical protein